MTKMIDLLEEFMSHRQHSFMRLDGSSKIHERRDMVADFQNRQVHGSLLCISPLCTVDVNYVLKYISSLLKILFLTIFIFLIVKMIVFFSLGNNYKLVGPTTSKGKNPCYDLLPG